jgi:hypothetical protein
MFEVPEKKVYDIYAAILNFKRSISVFNRPGIDFYYIPEDHLRRLKAYEILESFYYNYSRDYRFFPESGSVSQNDSILEPGDAAWVCDTIKSKLLGNGAVIAADLPEELQNVDVETLPAELQSLQENILEREKMMRSWWKKQNIFLKIDENERKCSYLGDCAYLVEWVTKKENGVEIGYPDLRTYDPGFVFPFFNCNDESLERNGQLVQDRVIIGWQDISKAIMDNIGSDQYFVIFRDIYELRIDKDGNKKCWRKHGYYKYNSSEEVDIYNLIDDNILNNDDKQWLDLGIDFMPVVVIPNITVQGHDFGLSNLHFILGMIDAIINTDTDLTKNSEKLGGATVFLAGKNISFAIDPTTGKPVPVEIQPNTMYALGEGGDANLLDTSAMQKALLDTKDVIEKKLLRNSHITEIGAGVLDIGQISTLSIKLLMQPLLDLIYPMRDQRNRYYSTIFFYVQRLYQIFGNVEQKKVFDGDIFDFIIKFGNLLPGDEKTRLEEYKLYEELTDTQTMLQKMKEDGYNIDIQQVIANKKKAKAEEVAANSDLYGLRATTDESSVGTESNSGNDDGGEAK